MPKEGDSSLTIKTTKLNRLKYVAKIRNFKSVQQMIYCTFLGEQKK